MVEEVGEDGDSGGEGEVEGGVVEEEEGEGPLHLTQKVEACLENYICNIISNPFHWL